MTRLRDTRTGVVVDVDDETAATLGAAYAALEADDNRGGYGSQTVADLKAEIASRNEGREEADLIPDEGKKADLVAALEADDNN